MTDKDGAMGARPGKSTGRFFGIVALFALLGPLIGGLVVSAYLGFLAATSQLATQGWAEAVTVFVTGTLFGTLFGLPIAYAVGIVPAVWVGLAVAIWDWRKRLISWRIAILAALVSWLLIAMRAGDIIETDEGTRIWQISILLAHLVATGLCWWLARTIFGRPLRPKAVGA